MHIHILGIGGTFMGGVAALAQAAGHTVSGQDQKLYPPMSTQLERLGIEVQEYSADALPQVGEVDMVVVGNVMSRGKPVVEELLRRKLPYTSGPKWLAENVLKDKWVLAVSGTHGKTTTASMLAWILEYNGYQPGFLIGGVPSNFKQSARPTNGNFFVVEADEYDSAFFDKRSKFVHYKPDTLIINNLEFDHADIFEDLAAIQKQFHHLVRTIHADGLIVYNGLEANIDTVLEQGCWTPTTTFTVSDEHSSEAWSVKQESSKHFTVYFNGNEKGQVNWQQIGQHNVQNALAAIAAAHHVGLNVEHACNALASFQGVKRRSEILHSNQHVTLYDDFAHHPTAIKSILAGIKKQYPNDFLIAVFDPHSNTMKRGEHNAVLAKAFDVADLIWVFQHEGLQWNIDAVFQQHLGKTRVFDQTSDAIEQLVKPLAKDQHSHIVILSNGSFNGLRADLLAKIV